MKLIHKFLNFLFIDVIIEWTIELYSLKNENLQYKTKLHYNIILPSPFHFSLFSLIRRLYLNIIEFYVNFCCQYAGFRVVCCTNSWSCCIFIQHIAGVFVCICYRNIYAVSVVNSRVYIEKRQGLESPTAWVLWFGIRLLKCYHVRQFFSYRIQKTKIKRDRFRKQF